MSIIATAMEIFKNAARAADAHAFVPPSKAAMQNLKEAGWTVEYLMPPGRPIPPIAIITTPEGHRVINRHQTPQDYARYLRARHDAVHGNGKADKIPALG